MGMMEDAERVARSLETRQYSADAAMHPILAAAAAGDEAKMYEIARDMIDREMDEQAAHSNAKHAALDEAQRRGARYGFTAEELQVDAEALIVIKVPHDYAEMNQLGQQLGKWLYDHFGCNCLVMPNQMDIQSVPNRALNQLGLYRMSQMHDMEQGTDKYDHPDGPRRRSPSGVLTNDDQVELAAPCEVQINEHFSGAYGRAYVALESGRKGDLIRCKMLGGLSPANQDKRLEYFQNALQAERLRVRMLEDYIDKMNHGEGVIRQRAPVKDLEPGQELEISPKHRKAFEEARKWIIQCTERATCEKPLEVDAKPCPGQRDV